MKKSNILFGPWVIMVILPWLFPIVFVALLIVAAIKESIEPLRKAHYWFFFSLIGLAVYVGIDFLVGEMMLDMILTNGV